jgi:hypothetical protein
MVIGWGMLWTKSRKGLKVGWLVTAGLLALYMGLMQPREQYRGIAQQKGTGLASMREEGWQPTSLWRQSRFSNFADKVSYQKGVVGGLPGSYKMQATLTAPATGGSDGSEEEIPPDRKLVRNENLNLIVKSPAQSSEKVLQLAQNAGGFLVTSQLNGGTDASFASLTIRVPAAKFDQVRAQIRQLGLRVDSESLEAQDVTKQYVDQEARLRNLRAQEQQYLGILRKATTVKDTLEVSDKLNEVRGSIEERQAEFEVLSKQVEMVAMNITLRAEADTQVFGLHWRPLYQLKSAAREGLDGIGDYAASMATFVFFLPTILLWLFTILVGAAIGWKILRWAGRKFFKPAKPAIPEPAA